MSMPAVPFDYTTRDYAGLRETMLRQIKARVPAWTGYNSASGEADAADFVVALVESVAFAADSMHYYLDRIANEAYVATAVRPESIMSMARMVGYRPTRGTAATVELLFTNSSDQTVTIPAGLRVQTSVDSEWGVGGETPLWEADPLPVVFETVQPLTLEAFMPGTVPAKEGLTFRGEDGTGEIIGVSDGYPWQSMTIPHSPVADNTVQVFVQFRDNVAFEWTKVEDIRSAPASGQVFQIVSSPTGPARILFGNGESGGIPNRGAVIKAVYKVGGGRRGNVKADSLTVIGDDISFAAITVTNPAPAAGGTDDEPLESIRNKIMWRGISTPDRATSLADYERIALTVTGVGKSRAYAPTGTDVMVVLGPLDDGTERPGTQRFAGIKNPLLPGKWLPADPAIDWTAFDSDDLVNLGYLPLENAAGDRPMWPAASYSTIGDHNIRWNSNSWELVSGQVDQIPEVALVPEFVDSVLPNVRSTLVDASSAGVQISVRPIEYVPVFVSVKIVADDPTPSRLVQAGAARIRQLFSYENVQIEQVLSLYGMSTAMSSPQFQKVEVKLFTINDPRLPGNDPNETLDTINLAVHQVPYIPSYITDADLVTVETLQSPQSRHLLGRIGQTGKGVTGYTVHTATRRSR